jgi:hypothetical protein
LTLTSIPGETFISLVVPGLLGIPSSPGTIGAPAAVFARDVRTYLARADRLTPQGEGYERQIFALFDVKPVGDSDLPIAAVTRALDMGVIDNDWWLRADPVHLRPMRDRLVLLDPNAVALTQDEATRLATELSQAYREAGWLLKTPRPGRWYLKPPHTPNMVTTPLPSVAGKDIHPFLPRGEDGKAWHTILNEMQILLHTASVNVEREERGELPINSLWFWGGGRLPNVGAVAWDGIYSDEPVSLGLARLANVPANPRPQHFEDWQQSAQSAGTYLIVLDQARAAVQYGETTQWADFVERFDHEWMEPSLRALKSGRVTELTLYTDSGRVFRLGRRQLRRWWRRRRPLAAYR